MAAAAACLNAARARADLRLWWLLPPIWGFFELVIPSIFPTFMSLAWAYHPRLIQIAEVGGAEAALVGEPPASITTVACPCSGIRWTRPGIFRNKLSFSTVDCNGSASSRPTTVAAA